MLQQASRGAPLALFSLFVSAAAIQAHESSGGAASAADNGAAPTEVIFHVQGDAAPGVVEIARGDRVRLSLIGAGDGELHLHGYDVTGQAEAGSPAVFDFEAAHSGRFPVTVHREDDLMGGGERALVYIEVRSP